jgi:Zn-dependent metalloprotease
MVNNDYLTQTSEYFDARVAWKQAADLYDPSGNISARVDAAWDAV